MMAYNEVKLSIFCKIMVFSSSGRVFMVCSGKIHGE